MTTKSADGLVFSQAEFLVLMDAVGAVELLGIDTDMLLPSDPEEHKRLVLTGIDQLVERGLMTLREDTHLLLPEVMLMARIVAFPELFTLLLRDDPGIGERFVAYYQIGPYIVEHTMPESGAYRLATIPNSLAQFQRIDLFLPVGQPSSSPRFQIEMAQEVFFAVRDQVLQGSLEQADAAMRSAGLSGAESAALLEAMQAPVFSGTVAYMRVESSNILDAYNLAVLQGVETAWVIQPKPSDRTLLSAMTLAQDEFKAVLLEAMRLVVQGPAGESPRAQSPGDE